ncbi:MAG TPA: nickel pincer cofactor biosynthesis protein LarB [Thermoanaerobaculia bacterium]|nr:nickel pincer cofactor biosynthesis protein LarB [Thermoanaerobaculia bacterium]
MTREELRELLAAVAAGKVGEEEALARIALPPIDDLAFAELDYHRELRNGLPEAVYGEGKTDEELAAIGIRLLAAHERLLVTRLDMEKAEALRGLLHGSTYYPRARLLTAGAPHPATGRAVGVLAAGTSDLAVAEEAAHVLSWYGYAVERHFDVGLAGVHRLLRRLPDLDRLPITIVVAGMDGALPTLVAGLLASPVIAVPTSVGYGASFGGLSALLTMLNACAPGIAVVNIDNGYGAAVLAHRILSGSSQSSERETSIASP